MSLRVPSLACTTLLAAAMLASGCTSMHVKRATYQMLAQGDCRLNQLDEFCHRNFSAEYHAYERLRQDFLRQRTPTMRTGFSGDEPPVAEQRSGLNG